MIAWVLGEQLSSGPDALPALHPIDRTGGDQAPHHLRAAGGLGGGS
jgi:hypothetical protein